ncbi:hypothetical protein G6F21_004407 [Rhizopus arrhizus]|nr:hypothetical protein G6F23_003586 [Rhizopus arrhizus]KAG0766599.1 hypothetical protein G6F24_003477 [Rhizopus arrhizus]KAG0792371.1 hypothetical protein G6F21_004407 [Rhizopus arrhizus]KAG0813707.1 hypothetical protein G6F20_005357 [Rhizopus arrhizus]KAG0898849.1 hypothetical protein G6F34_005249 [Rhizopus arrhizus]
MKQATFGLKRRIISVIWLLQLTPTYDSSDNLLNAALDDTNLFAEYSLNPSDFSTTADANTPECHSPGFYQRLFDI